METALLAVPCGYLVVVDGFEFRCVGGRVSVDGQGHSPHGACYGSGQAPVFPLLRVKCYCECHGYVADDVIHLKASCWVCQGRGWTPETDPLRVVAHVLETLTKIHRGQYDLKWASLDGDRAWVGWNMWIRLWPSKPGTISGYGHSDSSLVEAVLKAAMEAAGTL